MEEFYLTEKDARIAALEQERDEARLDRDNEAAAREGWYGEVARLRAAIANIGERAEMIADDDMEWFAGEVVKLCGAVLRTETGEK